MWSKLKKLFKLLFPIEKKLVPKPDKGFTRGGRTMIVIESTPYPPGHVNPYFEMMQNARPMTTEELEASRNLRGTRHNVRIPDWFVDYEAPLPIYHFNVEDIAKPQ